MVASGFLIGVIIALAVGERRGIPWS